MTQPITIFRAGTHTDMSGVRLAFTGQDLQAMAAAYDPGRHEAPLVLGHPQHDAQAHGWVKKLSVTPDGDLIATPEQVSEDLVGMVQEGRYKKISASFYTPTSPNNPKPGAYYLRHVGFLGAQPPAVKGLPDPAFKEGDDAGGVVQIEFAETPSTEDDEMPSEEEKAAAKKAAELKEREEKLAADQASFAEQQKSLDAKAQNLALAEKRARDREDLAFMEGVVEAGKVLPAEQAPLTALLSGLHGSQELSFSEGEGTVKKSPAEILKGFLSGLSSRVEYGELAAAEEGVAGSAATVQVPPGYTVDPASARLHLKTLAYAKAHNIEYGEALDAVTMAMESAQ
ncbi:MAG: hypothetical protein HQL52_17425 [Magnetococcales bacterium]|nr:hypothetical protein [Magnetococcales bacterium]